MKDKIKNIYFYKNFKKKYPIYEFYSSNLEFWKREKKRVLLVIKNGCDCLYKNDGL